MATSGLIVMARGAEAQRRLSLAFAGRQVHKRYVALVDGHLDAPGSGGEIDLPLIADWPNRPKQKVDRAAGKPSLTRYRVLAHEPQATRVELEPVTGRSHQLRVHLLAIGHAILGDMLYAEPPVQARSARLCLHASELRLAHPVSGEALVFHSAAPF
jgi:tRNA pseudouridine32 synthase/23S rRNA pseudouridine746 synthase